jgi:hypothetical protein
LRSAKARQPRAKAANDVVLEVQDLELPARLAEQLDSLDVLAMQRDLLCVSGASGQRNAA